MEEERAEARFTAEVKQAEQETVAVEVEEAEREAVKTEAKETKAELRGLRATFFASMALMFANVPIWTFIVPVIKDTALARISVAEQVLYFILVFIWVPLPAGEFPLFLYAINPQRSPDSRSHRPVGVARKNAVTICGPAIMTKASGRISSRLLMTSRLQGLQMWRARSRPRSSAQSGVAARVRHVRGPLAPRYLAESDGRGEHL